MGSLTSISITLVLSVFCVDIVLGSPVADPDPGVNVDVKVNVNDGGNGGSNPPPDCSSKDCNVDCGHWCYPSKNWPYTCGAANGFCDGLSQSPIDICADSTTSQTGSITFSASYSDPIDKIKINNNGHAAGASWDASLPTRTISGGGLPGDYTLAQFHFHWGCKNKRGSEHTVNGARYAMELHFVLFKTSYGNLSNALNYVDGLAVLGVFFEVGAENTALKPYTDGLPDIVKSGSEKEIDFNVALIDLIPTPTTQSFYRYSGSLTTPTCNEVVIWTVFTTPLSFSEGQVKAFRMLKDKEDHQMCDNYRGIQPLNGRVVEKYTP